MNALKHYSALPLILVPDNDKSGVTKANNYEPELNRIYQEFAQHYGVAVVPARVRKPKDKSVVKGTVGDIETWIIATLRNEVFFDFADLNAAIRRKLLEFSERPFQKREGTRRSVFLEYDLPAIRPLPPEHYEYSDWQIEAKVHPDWHAEIDKQYYSVPYAYVGQNVGARLTMNTVEIFCQNRRLCSHIRTCGKQRQYITDPSHLPPNQQAQLSVSREHFEIWAKTIGEKTALLVGKIFDKVSVEQIGYHSCLGLQRIARSYDRDRFESACKLDKQLIMRLYEGTWIAKNHNLLITGKTGVGKSYLACAMGTMACRRNYSVKYYRLPRLLTDLNISKQEADYNRPLSTLKKCNLLILDDFGLSQISHDDSRDILEVVEERMNFGSTLITSQLPVSEWYNIFEDPTHADAILDRIVHNSYTIEIEGPSMRDVMSMKNKTQRID